MSLSSGRSPTCLVATQNFPPHISGTCTRKDQPRFPLPAHSLTRLQEFGVWTPLRLWLHSYSCARPQQYVHLKLAPPVAPQKGKAGRSHAHGSSPDSLPFQLKASTPA